MPPGKSSTNDRAGGNYYRCWLGIARSDARCCGIGRNDDGFEAGIVADMREPTSFSNSKFLFSSSRQQKNVFLFFVWRFVYIFLLLSSLNALYVWPMKFDQNYEDTCCSNRCWKTNEIFSPVSLTDVSGVHVLVNGHRLFVCVCGIELLLRCVSSLWQFCASYGSGRLLF